MHLPINFLTLHRDSLRHAFFPANRSRAPFFDDVAKAWIVVNPAHCKDLIASNALRPATYAEDYQALQARLGIDFSSMAVAFDSIPLCQHAAPHERARRRVSEFLAGRKTALNARVPQAVSEYFDVMRRAGRVELMSATVNPLVLDIIATVAGIDIACAADSQSASVVFDRSIGVGKRRRIAEEIAILRERIAKYLGGNASDEDVGLRLALLILGRDALTGTLGESLCRLFEQNPGRRLSDIAYPELPPDTGVPWVERIAVTPLHFAGCDFRQGDRIRIFLQSFVYSDEPRSQTRFFGAGAHACLGRPLSLEVWNAIVAVLSGIPLRVELLSYAPRTSDYVFTCPETLEVELTP